jgi:hypothetical protein
MPVVEIHGPHHHPDDWRAEHVATILVCERADDYGARWHTHHAEPLQVATTRYPAGHKVAAHSHPPRDRPAFNGRTQEVLVVQSGRLLCHFWDSHGREAGSWTLRAGDMAIIVGGAHAFEVIEEVELTEIKQGPHVAGRDKVAFAGAGHGV